MNHRRHTRSPLTFSVLHVGCVEEDSPEVLLIEAIGFEPIAPRAQRSGNAHSLSLSMMSFSCAAGLNVTRANRNVDGFSIPGRAASAFYDRVKAILPETVIFFPLSLDESQLLAFVDDSLTGRVLFNGGMILCGLRRLSLLAGAAG